MRTGEDEAHPANEEYVEQPEEEVKEKKQEDPEKSQKDTGESPVVAAVLGNTEGLKQEFLEMLVENILKGHQPSPWSVEILPEISSVVVVFDNAEGKGDIWLVYFGNLFHIFVYFQLVK